MQLILNARLNTKALDLSHELDFFEYLEKKLYFYNATNSKCATHNTKARDLSHELVDFVLPLSLAKISYILSVILEKISLPSFGEIFQFCHVKHGAVVDCSPI